MSAVFSDLDECHTNKTLCTQPAVCYNTYGGYRCVCNGTDMNNAQSCILGKIIKRKSSFPLFQLFPSVILATILKEKMLILEAAFLKL